jgi:hypothetical protein
MNRPSTLGEDIEAISSFSWEQIGNAGSLISGYHQWIFVPLHQVKSEIEYGASYLDTPLAIANQQSKAAISLRCPHVSSIKWMGFTYYRHTSGSPGYWINIRTGGLEHNV